MPTTYRRLFAGSATGVLVIPTGFTFPHGSFDPSTGGPSVKCCHLVPPVAASNAYTEFPVVATITVSPTTRGSPYTSPSSPSDFHARWRPSAPGPSSVTPERVGSPPHVSHA